jgi:elongation factor Tu
MLSRSLLHLGYFPLSRTFSSTKQTEHFTVTTIGHQGHGKTTLVTAIHQYLYRKANNTTAPVSINEKVIASDLNSVSYYRTQKNSYTHIDCPGHTSLSKTVISACQDLNAAIVVIATTDGMMGQTKEHLKICRSLGVPYIIVYLSKVEQVTDNEILAMEEFEIRNFMQSLGYNKKNLFIIKGSAIEALKGSQGEFGEESIRRLIEVMDTRITQVNTLAELPLYMKVDTATSFKVKVIEIK